VVSSEGGTEASTLPDPLLHAHLKEKKLQCSKAEVERHVHGPTTWGIPRTPAVVKSNGLSFLLPSSSSLTLHTICAPRVAGRAPKVAFFSQMRKLFLSEANGGNVV
jgi:hypothetical protein